MSSPEDILRSLDKHLRQNPSDASAWNSKGVILAEMRQFGEALRCINQALHINSDLMEAHANRGRILLALGPEHAREALKSFDRVLAVVPDDIRILRDKSIALRLLGDAEGELTILQKISESVQDDKGLWTRMGDLALELGRFEKSIEYYDRVLTLDPTFVPAHIHRAIALSLSGQWKAALTSAQRATELAPDDAETWRILADVNLRVERFKAAMKSLKRASELRPEDPSIENTMGLIAFKSGQLRDALNHFRRAIALKHNHRAALRNLSLVYMNLEEWDHARETWSRLLRIAQDDPRDWDAYATTCARLNDFCTAHEAWDRARKLFKKEGDSTEAERVARLGRAARINCSRQKKAERARRERERIKKRAFGVRLGSHSKRSKKSKKY